MKLDWLRDEKTKTDKEEMKKLLAVSKPVLDKLLKICYNKADAYESLQLQKPTYTDSAWAYVQADHNGYIRALKEITELIESIEE